jgi:hypothetical protein
LVRAKLKTCFELTDLDGTSANAQISPIPIVIQFFAQQSENLDKKRATGSEPEKQGPEMALNYSLSAWPF